VVVSVEMSSSRTERDRIAGRGSSMSLLDPYTYQPLLYFLAISDALLLPMSVLSF
jgi:hypothetical protein